MIRICLFDLDETLVRTNDMEHLRSTKLASAGKKYKELVQLEFGKRNDRLIYSKELLLEVREKFPETKMGVFTRSPRAYATAVLDAAYDDFEWDIVITYDDVKRTKPFGDGIDKAMHHFGVKYLNEVILIGDSDVDVRSAYHAGCLTVLDRSSWPDKLTTDHWSALSHIPDAVIYDPRAILDVLEDYTPFLPELERLISETAGRPASPRYDRVNKFIPKEIGGDTTPFPVYSCGRSFAGYESLQWRKKWHELTKSIHDHKDSAEFPEEWITAIRQFIRVNFSSMCTFGGTLHVTAIPARPGREPRLSHLLEQFRKSLDEKPMKGNINIEIHPSLLSYKDGVRSNSNDKLGRIDRFVNVRDHLQVEETSIAEKGGHFLVIDDVCTTGSTLIYSKRYLIESGAISVTLLSIAMNISNVIRS